jgi:DNA mismatch repair protein MutL
VKEGLRKMAKGPEPPLSRTVGEPCSQVYDPPAAYGTPPSGGVASTGRVDFIPPQYQPGFQREGFFSSLEILGQLLGCYLICSSPRGLTVIDQHAAHERVAFERMRHRLKNGEIERQSLLIPQVLELPPGEAALLEPLLELLDRAGFGVEKFGRDAYVILTAPALLPAGDYREALRRMTAEIADVGESRELGDGLEDRLATIACHSVIRAHRKLDREEIRALFDDLDRIDFATQCPHGRPVLIELAEEQLERMFKRV